MVPTDFGPAKDPEIEENEKLSFKGKKIIRSSREK